MSRNAFTLRSALALPVLTIALCPAEAIELTVKVVSAKDSNEVIPWSTIYQRIGDTVEDFDTDDSGSRTFSVNACDGSIAFRAKPGTWLYTEVESWTVCSGDPVLIRLPEVGFAAALLPAFRGDFGTSSVLPPGIQAAHGEFLAHVKAGDDAAAAAVANDIAAQFRQFGDTETAGSYSAAAMYGGWQALGVNPAPENGKALLALDPGQNLYVMTPAGKDVLQDFQVKAHIPKTGAWDWRTYEALTTVSPNT